MYSIDFSTILNLTFKSTQNDNNYFHFSAIRINVQEAINYTVIKMKKYYDNYHQFKFFQFENKIQL